MTFDEWIGNYKLIERGVTANIPERLLAQRAEGMGWVGDGDPYGTNNEYRLHAGLFSRNPDVLTRKGPYWDVEPLAVAVHRTGRAPALYYEQIVAYNHHGISWCRFDHRKRGLATQCSIKRSQLYPDYMARTRARIAYMENNPEQYTDAGVRTLRLLYDWLVDKGVIQVP